MSMATRTIFTAPKCATRRRIAPKSTARRRFLIAGTGDITDGSGKAASYIRALDMLGLILTRHYPKPIVGGSMWYSFSLADIHAVLPRVPWMLGMLIIDKCHSQLEKALFCVRRTIQNGWSRDMLRNRLSTDLYEREDKAQANFVHRVCISSSTCEISGSADHTGLLKVGDTSFKSLKKAGLEREA